MQRKSKEKHKKIEEVMVKPKTSRWLRWRLRGLESLDSRAPVVKAAAPNPNPVSRGSKTSFLGGWNLLK